MLEALFEMETQGEWGSIGRSKEGAILDKQRWRIYLLRPREGGRVKETSDIAQFIHDHGWSNILTITKATK